MAELRRVHGSENTFFLLDQTTLRQKLDQATLVALTQKITDRRFGLLGGADGMLIVDDAPQATGAMTVINADGSLAKMCGNGLRTVARYLSEKTGQQAFAVQTAEAKLRVRHVADFAAGVPGYSVEISPVSFAAAALPFASLNTQRIVDQVLPALDPALHFTAVAVPNPHLIAFVGEADLAGEKLGALGRRLNAPNPYFPEGVNVTFAAIEGPHTLFARTFERGVGFTNACGTGMAATSLAFVLTHPEAAALDQVNTVYNPGGVVKTNVHGSGDDYWIELIGNATTTHLIAVPEAALRQADFAGAEVAATGEAVAYEAYVATLPYRGLVAAI
ncbi:diaminopimelate epimerase [Lacticaseibacillus jixianensis]|uniref:Diaminopimelate epimerase n=1 Tax=Lacticaseibacillus jixianensis TaxID=2486012 RepID=A0ABW4B8Q3_9LACO|nr:diaminopimelate epimerase [Lacticaseibacillus jixianensis]